MPANGGILLAPDQHARIGQRPAGDRGGEAERRPAADLVQGGARQPAARQLPVDLRNADPDGLLPKGRTAALDPANRRP